MSSSFDIAVSGLRAATVRLSVAAENIVNARSSAPVEPEGPGSKVSEEVYRPQRVAQRSRAEGGVTAERRPVEPATFTQRDATSPTGFSAVPNVDFGRELVDLRIAAQSFKASVEAIRTQMELDKALLDIKA
jgi:flagellar basal-body rod protein FlgC